MNDIDFVDARPRLGYLTHAVHYRPENFVRMSQKIVHTVLGVRTLCGIGSGGLYVRLDESGDIQPYKGIDGCDTCFIRVRDIRKGKA